MCQIVFHQKAAANADDLSEKSSMYHKAESINIDRKSSFPLCFFHSFGVKGKKRAKSKHKKGNKKRSEIIKNDDMKAHLSWSEKVKDRKKKNY